MPLKYAALLARHPDFRQVAVPQRLEVRARLLDRRAGRKTPDHAQPPALLRLQTLFDQHHRQRDVERRPDLEPEESRRCDPDDRHPLRADLNGLPEHCRIPAEAARPEAVADDGDRAVWTAPARLGIVGGRQQSSVGGANTEQVEVGAGGVLTAHPLRHAVDRHLEQPFVERRDTREEPVVIAEPLEAGIGRAVAAAGLPAGVVDEEQSLRVVDRQRLDQHGVDQAEDRGVGADPEPERQQGHQRERRRPPQQPECVADVAAQLVDQPQADGVAAFLLARVNAAELGERTPASLLFRDTPPPQIRLIELEVDPHLVLHLTLEVSPAAADSKPRLDARDETHTSSGTASSANPIASESRRQYAVSSLRRRRPAAVSR